MGDNTVIWVSHFALILARLTAIFTVSPVLGRANVPLFSKVLLSVLLTFIILPLHPAPDTLAYATVFHYAFAVGGELIVGLLIGYLNTVFFSVVFTAGQMIDTQIGFGMVQVYDVQSNIQIPIAGSLLNLVMLECFLLADGQLKLIQIISRTFNVIPVGRVTLSLDMVTAAIESFTRTFALAISIAMPIVAAGLLAEVALGIIVRTAPQMNVFVVGLPLKVIIGLVMLIVTIPAFIYLTDSLFNEMFEAIDAMFTAITP